MRLPTPTLPRRTSRPPSGRADGAEPDGMLDDAPEWARVIVYALLAAFVPASLVVTLVFAAWLASTASSVPAGTAIATGLLGWLFAHGVPLNLGRGSLGLIPWLLTLLPLLSVRWSAQRLLAPQAAQRHRARPTDWVRGDVLVSAVGFCMTYALVAFLVGTLARLPGASVQPALAALCAFVVALLGVAWAGAQLFGGHLDRVIPRVVDAWCDYVPAWLRRAVAPSLRGVIVLLGVGALALVVVTALSVDRVASLYGDLAPGWVGGAVLTIGQLLYLPTGAAWVLSVIVGPGFSAGGPAVSVGYAHGGALPLVPAFGLLPDPGPLPDLFRLVLLVPVAVGFYVGWVAVRRGARLSAWRQRLVSVVAACLLTGLLTTAVFALASGGLGSERLDRLGPAVLPAGAALTGELLLGGLLAALVTGLRVNRLPRRRAARKPRAASGNTVGSDSTDTPPDTTAAAGSRASEAGSLGARTSSGPKTSGPKTAGAKTAGAKSAGARRPGAKASGTRTGRAPKRRTTGPS